uniref:Ribonuclease H-like domain-containing protein n=1 Tax=Tanacetum cinerariifolium TaxID=118510 RepID=A0A6L2NX98_TANCI|nr:ribonuclease H-like domain-containing protein [Tanacetum cinerariifolium]
MAWDDTIITNTTSISPLPKSPFLALQNPHWNNAMHDEYNALFKNGIWILIPRPAGINFVRSIWLFKLKFHVGGTLSHYKACLVSNGSSQQLGIDCDETFSQVVKPATIRIVLSLAVFHKWPIHQLDVKNTFLNGDLSKTNSVDTDCKLGPEGVPVQDPKNILPILPPTFLCNQTLALNPSNQMAWDDTIITNTTSISPLPKSPFLAFQNPHWNNAMHDEYNALFKNGTWILVPRPAGINFVRPIWLFKHKFHVGGTLSHYKARLVANGSSQQLGFNCDETFSRVVKPATIRTVLSLVVFRKWPIHRLDVKNIFLMGIYLKLYIYTPTTKLYGPPVPSPCFPSVEVFIWSETGTSCLVFVICSAEAEYQVLPNVIAETAWLRNLLRELHSPLSAATLVYCDNVRATYLSANLVQNQRTKHIEIDIHFVRDLVTAGQVRVLHVPSRYQAINEDDRLVKAINGLCDGLTTAIEEKEKYILAPSQRRW